MSAQDALYQELILDHNRKPRNFREIADADRRIEARNPSCGDQLTLWLKMDGDRVADVAFRAEGCAISKASASLMTVAVKGKTREEAQALFEKFHDLVIGRLPESEHASLGSLRALAGVSRFPMRVKCASLSWHALHSALESSSDEIVSTELAGDGEAPTEGA
jgi:nitrogen fixation protein NifU and related proteins